MMVHDSEGVLAMTMQLWFASECGALVLSVRLGGSNMIDMMIQTTFTDFEKESARRLAESLGDLLNLAFILDESDTTDMATYSSGVSAKGMAEKLRLLLP